MMFLWLLLTLVLIFTPYGNLFNVVVFGYLAALSFLTVPPPYPGPIEDAIKHAEERSGESRMR